MKISAIIPIYNGKRYLRAAVCSVLNQTLKPIELILIDDGSTDDSLSVLKDIQAPFPVHIIQQKNRGQSAARNHGVKIAKGDLIALLDQDDLWHKNHLEQLSAPFGQNDALGWVYSNLDLIDEQGRIFQERLLDSCPLSHPLRSLNEMIMHDMHILPSATLIRKTAFTAAGMFDEKLSGYEDDDLFLRLFLQGWSQCYLPISLSQWRIHAHNSGRTTSLKSRKVYAEKLIGIFSTLPMDQKIVLMSLIGKRFFTSTLSHYADALHRNAYADCKQLWFDLKRYAELTSQDFQTTWKHQLFLRRYPKLFKCLWTIKQTINRIQKGPLERSQKL
jgi:glycosyltransferase involved in cell wall biosynthesis